MKLSFRANGALLVLALAAAPARVLAQEAEAWVLPRGLLELSGGGLFTQYDSRLGYGDPAFGSEFLAPLSAATQRVTGAAEARVQAGLADLLGAPLDPDSLSAGRLNLRLGADERIAPLSVRYGLTNRLTLSITVPIERRGTTVVGPYFAGATLGLNPDEARNRTVLAGFDPRFGDLGGGLLLPLRGTAAAVALQTRLRARSAADTLILPTAPLTVAQFLADEEIAAQLTDEELAALGLVSGHRSYMLGDLQLGARFLLRRGPAGWPYPDSVTGRSLRTSVGARVRLPTGRSGTRFFTEIPPGGGHLGFGVDVLNDVFLSDRWYVNASASVDVLLPADVERQAFSLARPFPADSAVRTVRREPGQRLAVSITPRWRLTDEISFSGEYALLAQTRTNYTGGDADLVPSPLEWRTGGSLHAVGLGARYSSLQAYARGRANVPFEVSLTLSRAIAGGGVAPDVNSVRLTGRIFMDPRGFRALLPGGTPPPADTAAPPASPPADTLPGQLRPDVAPAPRVVPPQPDTAAADSARPQAPPPARPQASVGGRPNASSFVGSRRSALAARRPSVTGQDRGGASN
ncbi:hypothetical protein [Longimicrobium sp.]|uniref:hypothetical protein n=1 Tax=Longimicrobium sp. TaxID=2029185 RepID=UPI002E3484CE|nr:hypothetical protein [Longimicrobium sp.]HEX6039582.1 hypothetical protein [Longimicrobium sp.]